MNKKKKIWMTALGVVAILMIGTSFVFAANSDVKRPADIVAELTGKSVDEVRAARQEGVSFAAQAQEAGVLPAFQEERLALFEERLDMAVQDGKMTQEDADKRLEEMKLRQENCDGTCIEQGDQMRLGMGPKDGKGIGPRDGSGIGPRDGSGIGPRDGSGNQNEANSDCESCTEQG